MPDNATLTGPDSHTDLTICSRKRNRLDMRNQSSSKGEYDVPEPKMWYNWGDTIVIVHDYAKALNVLLDMNLERDQIRLLQSINKLTWLHQGCHRDPLVYMAHDLNLRSIRIPIIQRLKDSLFEYRDIFGMLLNDDQLKRLADMCDFMYFASLIKKDFSICRMPD